MTAAGQLYSLSFDLAVTPPDFPDEGLYEAYAVSFNNAVLGSGNPTSGFHYQHFAYNVTGTGGSDQISFAFQNQPAYFALDNISLSAVPEPATWAMMIGGFGMVGGAMRRRRSSATVSYS